MKLVVQKTKKVYDIKNKINEGFNVINNFQNYVIMQMYLPKGGRLCSRSFVS